MGKECFLADASVALKVSRTRKLLFLLLKKGVYTQEGVQRRRFQENNGKGGAIARWNQNEVVDTTFVLSQEIFRGTRGTRVKSR
jgi:hypothetical protein